MSDLATRLRELVDTEVPPLDVELLIADLYATHPPAPARRGVSRRLAVAAATAAVTVVVVGGLMLLAGRDTPEGPAVSDPPVVPPTGVLDAPVLDPFTWESAELPGELATILEFDGGYVAHMFTADGYPYDGANWLVTSVDGLTWAPLLEQPQWAGGGQSLGVYLHDNALWTAAWSDDETGLTVERLATIGLGWDPVPLEDPGVEAARNVEFATSPGGAVLFAIAASGRPLLWVLGDDGFELVESSWFESLPWASGETERSDLRNGRVRWLDLVATERGFLALPAADSESGAEIPAAAYSIDGRTWDEVASPPIWGWGGALAARDGEILAFGDQGLYLSSDDGVSWSLLSTDPPLVAMGIAAGPLGWIVPNGQAGIFWEGPTDLLISDDGVHWEVALEDTPVVHGMLVTEDAIVFGASRGGWGPTTYEVWVGRSASGG